MRLVRLATDHVDPSAIREAAELLRAGRLVAFPTETVYGLGAHALDPAAVQRIYDAKGRPAVNPIIVHVANVDAARALAAEWSATTDALARKFWPGPLTLVVRKRKIVPDIVSAGADTVGLRVPAHPVALALLSAAAIPVAAPSANLSTQLSPTTAQHVERGLGDRVDMILDGGPTTVGIESTVVDVTGSVPRILRPGMLSAADIARVTGSVAERDASVLSEQAPRSPGLLGRHYAPSARVRVFTEADRAQALAEARDVIESGGRAGAMVFRSSGIAVTAEYTMPSDPAEYARQLYSTLHALDASQCAVVFVELPPDTAEWAAIRDRIRRTTLR